MSINIKMLINLLCTGCCSCSCGRQYLSGSLWQDVVVQCRESVKQRMSNYTWGNNRCFSITCKQVTRGRVQCSWSSMLMATHLCNICLHAFGRNITDQRRQLPSLQRQLVLFPNASICCRCRPALRANISFKCLILDETNRASQANDPKYTDIIEEEVVWPKLSVLQADHCTGGQTAPLAR